jgi:hypothetical protein
VPKRKKKCPHCSNFIYVRNGILLTENAVVTLKGKGISAAMPVTTLIPKDGVVDNQSSNLANSNPSIGQNQSYTSGSLEEDLKHYANELYTKQDLNAGWELIKELVGVVAVGGFALAALTVWLPGVGITVGTGTAIYLMTKVAEEYNNLDADERKQVRAVIKKIKGYVD